MIPRSANARWQPDPGSPAGQRSGLVFCEDGDDL
jgi:hypothetical protein